MFKRISASLLAMLLLLQAVSCAGKSDAGEQPETTSESAAEETVETTEAETTTELIAADVPDSDFEGAGFVILTYDDGNLATRLYKNSDIETETGDTISDAIYRRNLEVEEKLNIDISQFAVSSVESTAKKAIMAGDDSYQSVISSISHVKTLATSGYLLNLPDLEYLDLDKPYWDANMKDSLTILGKLYYDTGDITVFDDMRVVCAYFNKELWANYELESPYDLVYDGKWTIDRMSELGANVTTDLDGNGTLDQYDMWGIVSENGGGNDFYFASGERMVTLDSSGIPQIVFNTQRASDAVERVLAFFADTTNVFNADKIKNVDDIWKYASAMFQEDRVLMRTSCFENIPRDYRAMDTDFGVLPFPKFDESQDAYYTFARADIYVACIPMSVADTDLSSITLECLAASSRVYLTPAFYEISLQGKVLRDDESSGMLDIIFGNKVYDIGYLFTIGGFDSILSGLISSGKTDFASKLESSMSKAQTALDTLVENYSEVG